MVTLFEVHQEQGNGSRSQARDARRLAERRRAQVAQALARLVGQAADFRVIDVERQPQFFIVLLPIDLVGSVVFFASPDSDFITGQTLVVDGGATMH